MGPNFQSVWKNLTSNCDVIRNKLHSISSITCSVPWSFKLSQQPVNGETQESVAVLCIYRFKLLFHSLKTPFDESASALAVELKLQCFCRQSQRRWCNWACFVSSGHWHGRQDIRAAVAGWAPVRGLWEEPQTHLHWRPKPAGDSEHAGRLGPLW